MSTFNSLQDEAILNHQGQVKVKCTRGYVVWGMGVKVPMHKEQNKPFHIWASFPNIDKIQYACLYLSLVPSLIYLPQILSSSNFSSFWAFKTWRRVHHQLELFKTSLHSKKQRCNYQRSYSAWNLNLF
jgi:hypothetical protein